jgi:hypothetical protein
MMRKTSSSADLTHSHKIAFLFILPCVISLCALISDIAAEEVGENPTRGEFFCKARGSAMQVQCE